MRTEDGGVGRPPDFWTIEVPGHKKTGQALESDVLNAVLSVIPSAVADRVESAFFGGRQEAGSLQYALPDSTGTKPPLSGRRIAADEFGQLMAGGGLAEIGALTELGFGRGSLLGHSTR